MIVKILDNALVELYKTGKTSDKRYRKLTPNIVHAFVKTVKIMEAVKQVENLKQYNGLRYERLATSKSERRESVRLNNKWRLIFSSSASAGIIIDTIELIEINAHYGDN